MTQFNGYNVGANFKVNPSLSTRVSLANTNTIGFMLNWKHTHPGAQAMNGSFCFERDLKDSAGKCCNNRWGLKLDWML